jgi:hypothetical protein
MREGTQRNWKRGESAYGIVQLAIGIIVGLYVVATVYTGFIGTGATTTLDSNVELAINQTFTTATVGFTLLAVGIIVAAAAFIINILR